MAGYYKKIRPFISFKKAFNVAVVLQGMGKVNNRKRGILELGHEYNHVFLITSRQNCGAKL
jgi:hypothetical protein